MKNKLNIKKLISTITFGVVLATTMAIPLEVKATTNDNTTEIESGRIIGYIGEEPQTRNSAGNIVNEIMNNTFYIKNAFSGQYLDVSGGVASDGQNVQQYPNNGTASQRWYVNYNGDGTFTLYSNVNSNFVLDVDGGSGNDLANVHLWSSNGSDAQKFKIGYTENSTYVIVSKTSNYTKAVVTHGYGCAMGDNVNQYTYSGHWNERWILEPVSKNVTLGAKYAMDNYNQYIACYPNLDNFGGDCTNFVSQCMLASGIHYDGHWGTYRRNSNYTEIYNVDQLNNSWSLTDPSPWISAKEFRNFWKAKLPTVYRAKGTDILNDPSIVWNAPITQGCVVQKADNFLGVMGDSTHSMYITGYLNNNTYLLTYHSSNTYNRSLLDFCRQEPDAYYLFYVFQ